MCYFLRVHVSIRPYQPVDKEVLTQCLAGLQGFIHALDPLERVRGIGDFDARAYTTTLLEGVERKTGAIYLAEDASGVLGCIAGWIIPADEEDLLGHYEARTGRVIELFVSEHARGKGIGRALMTAMEDYLRNAGCDSVRIEVFSGNDAEHFYRKLGYSDRCIDMMKML